ncbi:hypothetical protein HYFRA_00001185 [Hymenoscyphus fraxineus]|uniref:Uncharacterized protein n=1 Tax=Hymenoscyphus fraxineus TaxID=746836 RepID=A0A9N9KTK2_9HELO|nr:hypothetical protein HYFRA_00001185 [Hymenoscyphus fraxineus]
MTVVRKSRPHGRRGNKGIPRRPLSKEQKEHFQKARLEIFYKLDIQTYPNAPEVLTLNIEIARTKQETKPLSDVSKFGSTIKVIHIFIDFKPVPLRARDVIFFEKLVLLLNGFALRALDVHFLLPEDCLEWDKLRNVALFYGLDGEIRGKWTFDYLLGSPEASWQVLDEHVERRLQKLYSLLESRRFLEEFEASLLFETFPRDDLNYFQVYST